MWRTLVFVISGGEVEGYDESCSRFLSSVHCFPLLGVLLESG